METKPTVPRKMDRRTIYTRNVVKEALLELLKERPFEKITVALLCRQAEISRATFYLHFTDINAVLDELLDDALVMVEASIDEMSIANRMAGLKKIIHSGDVEQLRQNEGYLPTCQRLADNPKYRVIFQDTTLSSYVIRRVYMAEREQMIHYLMNQYHFSQDEADRLLMMLIHGLFSANCSLKWSKDDNWYRTQLMFNRFILGGLEMMKKYNK